jgi:hypothetical protein
MQSYSKNKLEQNCSRLRIRRFSKNVCIILNYNMICDIFGECEECMMAYHYYLFALNTVL